MEIVGNVNITGAYNINNRNVIADTSNYILSTSNILAVRIQNTSNALVSRIDTKQNTINSTAGQIIIGNGNGFTTTNASLTFTNNDTLNAPKFVGNGSGLTNLPTSSQWTGTTSLTFAGNVAIGTTDTATYKLNVAGDINISGAFRVGGTAITGSKWTAGTPSTNIYYNAGNVGIGNTNPTGTLCLGNSSVGGSDGFLLIGKNDGAGGARTQRIGYNTGFNLTIGDYGGGTGPWIEAVKFSYGSPVNSLVVNSSGNLGINNASPTAKLHIIHSHNNDDPTVGGLYVINPTNSAGQNSYITNRIGGSSAGKVAYSFDVYGSYGYSIKMDANSSALKFNNNWAGTGTDNMIINSNGYVGIGTTPSYKLHIKMTYDNIPTGLYLDAADGSNQYNLTIYSYVQGGGQVGWRFRTQSFDGGTNTPLQFFHNGSSLMNALTVSSFYSSTTIQSAGAFYFANNLWHKCNASNDRLYFSANSTTYIKSGTGDSGRQIEFRSSSDYVLGYFQNTYFYCYGPIGLSDRRIKRDIVEINDETALNMLLLVQPTTYYYRDEARNKGNGKVYGFIAQQIKEVIPDAVSITKDIIANIYKTCLVYNKREIYHSIPQDVAIDTEVMINNKGGEEKGKRYKIKEIYEDYFVIDEDIDSDDCFVFGYMVNDLNGLDKSYIYTLNVCATQELHRRIEAQNVIIKSQDERIKELEAKMEMLINKITI